MELGYNKNLTLYLRKQYHPNTGTKLGKSKKRMQKEVGTFTAISHRKENINKPGHA